MKNIFKLFVIAIVAVIFSNNATAQTAKYKCMIQMQNYSGKEAYVIVSLINPKGEYEKTLAVLGPDHEWYNTLPQWDKFRKKKNEKLNAITGASVAGGARASRVLEFDSHKIDKGYKIRFESAVETQKYHVKDAEVALTTAELENKAGAKGTGYIRLVRFNKVQ